MALAIATLVPVAVSLVAALISIPSGAFLLHPSGVWTALAVDASHGVWFRPLLDGVVYGGTRYMPLHPALQASGMLAGLTPVAAGHVVGVLSTLALALATGFTSRRLGASPRAAVFAAALVPVATSGQLALLSIRGDALAAAANVAGFGVALGDRDGRRGPIVAALLFGAAFATKLTTVFGAAAAVVALARRGRIRAAVWLAAATGVAWAAVVGLCQLVSGGRALDVVLSSASGGTSIATIVRGPLRMVRQGMLDDPVSILTAALAALALCVPRLRDEAAGWLFVATVGATALIYGAPGTDMNHLIDVHAAALCVLAVAACRMEPAARRGLALVLPAAVVAACVPIAIHVAADAWPPRDRIGAAAAAVADAPGPLLTEHALVAVRLDKPVEVLDPFVVRGVAVRDPAFVRPLLDALRARRYGAVVLLVDPMTEVGRRWYAGTHFGPGFVEALEAGYRPDRVAGRLLIYRPRSEPAVAASPRKRTSTSSPGTSPSPGAAAMTTARP